MPEDRQIFLSRGAVELIWSASLAHYRFYTRLIQGKTFDQFIEIDPRADPAVGDSLDLLSWALKCQSEKSNAYDWPSNLPHPLEMPASGSDEEVADELCRAGCAYILHHEVAHVRLEHDPAVKDHQSISQEKEADIEAADWILDRLNDRNDPRFKKRLLGIAQTMVLLTALGLYSGNFGGKRHPFSYDRLSSLLNRFLGSDEHVARTFTLSTALLHLNNSGRKLREREFETFNEALEAVCDQLANEVHGQSLTKVRVQ